MEPYKFTVNLGDGDQEFSFLEETHEIRQNSQLAYNQAFAFYLKNGTLTRGQALDLAKQNGVIDDAWQKRVDLLIMQLANDTALIKKERDYKVPNKAKITSWVKRIKQNRELYSELLQRHTEVLLPTCENLSENREIEYAVAFRLVDVDGARVYKDHTDLVSQYNKPLTALALEHMMYCRAGMEYQPGDPYSDVDSDDAPEEKPTKTPAKKKKAKTGSRTKKG